MYDVFDFMLKILKNKKEKKYVFVNHIYEFQFLIVYIEEPVVSHILKRYISIYCYVKHIVTNDMIGMFQLINVNDVLEKSFRHAYTFNIKDLKMEFYQQQSNVPITDLMIGIDIFRKLLAKEFGY